MSCSASKCRRKSCPLFHGRVNEIDWTNVSHLEEIDSHLASVDGKCIYFYPNLKDLNLPGEEEGSTALALACNGGNLDVARHVVERWDADVNKQGVCSSLRLGRRNVKQAYPLFVATVRSHYEIVRYLIDKGANVSALTFNSKDVGVTALHAAISSKLCNKETLLKESIIRHLVQNGANPSETTSSGVPMWKWIDGNIPCLRLLIKLGMNLNQREPKHGRTIIHHWARKRQDARSLAVIKLLLRRTGDDYRNQVDGNGFTPLYLAALGKNGKPNCAVMHFFLDHDDVSVVEKITALELAGSQLISYDGQRTEEGMKLWREAMRLREAHQLPKTPHTITTQIKEFTTVDDLEEMQSSEFECMLQSFLVRQRILKKISFRVLEAHQWPIVDKYLNSEGEVDGRIEICRDLIEPKLTSHTPDSAYTILIYVISYLTLVLKPLKISDSISSISGKGRLYTAFKTLTLAYLHFLRDNNTKICSRSFDTWCFFHYAWDQIFGRDGIIPDNDRRMMELIPQLVERDNVRVNDWVTSYCYTFDLIDSCDFFNRLKTKEEAISIINQKRFITPDHHKTCDVYRVIK